MPVIYQTSSSNILTFKVVLISCSVLSAAILLTVTDFADHVPSIYSALVSWLRPPYLYLVINCIIISIVASSKLQSAKDDASPTDIPQPLDAMGIVPPQPVKSIQTVDYPTTAEFKYDGVVFKYTSSYEVKVEKGLEYDSYERSDATRNQDLPVIVNAGDGGAVFEEDAMSNKENEYVMVKSTWTAPESNDLNEYSPSILKPSVSARFSHRRNVKASPEGGRTVLGVSKSKRQNTLENTWKAITEGRQIPISRHLRKSDTWERDNHIYDGTDHQKPEKTMKKSDTFNQQSSTNSPSGVGEGSGKLRKEASLSQDELNKRVEAFIKKFNEEMRLQRQESLNQYMDMINRGSH